MKLDRELTKLLNDSFDFHLKWVNNHVREYQKALIQTIKESDIQQEVDRMFIYELVEQVFQQTLTKYLAANQQDIDTRNNLMDQVNDILDIE